ncbi:hypothetical protein AsAng_0057110 [Aureispira anguillae]|uniref:Uncharacterized protein n=1 Tax=Aureispira anguillae TaxID=2864201 RepID=A0A915YKZ4_9BACT|nr:hypothetical protein AsAng_0057110 [Aureispira anguillae]
MLLNAILLIMISLAFIVFLLLVIPWLLALLKIRNVPQGGSLFIRQFFYWFFISLLPSVFSLLIGYFIHSIELFFLGFIFTIILLIIGGISSNRKMEQTIKPPNDNWDLLDH